MHFRNSAFVDSSPCWHNLMTKGSMFRYADKSGFTAELFHEEGSNLFPPETQIFQFVTEICPEILPAEIIRSAPS